MARVVAVDVTPPAASGAKIRYYAADFTEPLVEARLAEILAAESIDTVVHLAFLAAPSHAHEWAHEVESVGTRHLLLAAQQVPLRKVVLWSQTWLYGARPSNPAYLDEAHPLRALRSEPYFRDKIEAERELARYAERRPDTITTVLRTAPILGRGVRNAHTRYLARRLVPTLMGFDPLMQFLHEVDALRALKLAVDADCRGTFNIVGDGVLPLSTVVRLAGRMALPIPEPIARPLARGLWLAQQLEAPPAFLPYLRYPCVADGARAARELRFRPEFTTREALLDYASAQHLRDVRLLTETTP